MNLNVELYLSPSLRITAVIIVIIIIIIIIDIPSSLLHNSSAGSQKSTGVTDQAFLIHCPAKNFVTIRHVLSITGPLGSRNSKIPEFLDNRHTKVLILSAF